MTTQSQRVFVSYAHEARYDGVVTTEVEFLRRNGVEARFDRLVVGSPREGWPQWMENEIASADAVMIVCTPTYRRRYVGDNDHGKGKGVAWEGAILRQELYDSRTVSDKFIPVLLEGCTPDHIPLPLRGHTHYTLPADREALLRLFTGQPAYIAPPVGEIPLLPPSAPLPTVTIPQKDGWIEEVASSVTAARGRQLTRFFDGAQPTWRHGLSEELPKRRVVHSTLAEFRQAAADKDPIGRVIVAAAGEGKSTALLQVAAILAIDDGWSILRRDNPLSNLTSDIYTGLPRRARPWLILVDDADTVITDLSLFCGALRDANRNDIFLIGAARHTDWLRALQRRRQSTQATSTGLAQFGIEVREISELNFEEAQTIVNAWHNAGAGMRMLETIIPNRWPETLLKASRGAQGRSLFGAILNVRFTPEALLDHARDLIHSLRTRHTGTIDLADILICVAFAETGFGGISPDALAELANVTASQLWSGLLHQLAGETAIVRGGDALFTRSPDVAAALVAVAYDTFAEYDLGECATRIVSAVENASRRVRLGETYAHTMHSGPHLAERLPKTIPSDMRHRIAIDTARAVAATRPNRLDSAGSLAETLFRAGQQEEGLTTLRDAQDRSADAQDRLEHLRSFYLTSAVAEGKGDIELGAWLALLSLSDACEPATWSTRGASDQQAKMSLASLGRALELLVLRDRAKWQSGALMATVVLGELTILDATARSYFVQYRSTATEHGSGEMLPIEAISALSAASDHLFFILSRSHNIWVARTGSKSLRFDSLAKLLRLTRRST